MWECEELALSGASWFLAELWLLLLLLCFFLDPVPLLTTGSAVRAGRREAAEFGSVLYPPRLDIQTGQLQSLSHIYWLGAGIQFLQVLSGRLSDLCVERQVQGDPDGPGPELAQNTKAFMRCPCCSKLYSSSLFIL